MADTNSSDAKGSSPLLGIGTGALFVAVLTFFFGSNPFGGSPATAKREADRPPTSTPSADKPLPAGTFLTPLYDYLGRRPAAGQPLRDYLAGERVSLDCLVMTIPDPVRSPLTDRYDQGMEAVQQAHADASGYVTEARMMWLPWDGGRPRPGADGQPGFMLFRAGQKEQPLRAVLLVPETPNAGIDQAAWLAALETVRDAAPAGRQPEYRVLGPTYTGSQPSVAVGVRNWYRRVVGPPWYLRAPDVPRFRFLSGTVGWPRPLDSVWPDEFIPAEYRGNDRRLVFRTTVIPHDILERAALQYLRRDEPPPEGWTDVATLSEANSGYGLKMAAWEDKREKGGAEAEAKPVPQPLQLRYPLHIGRTLNEYARAKEQITAKLAPAGTVADRKEADDRQRMFPTADPVGTGEAAQVALDEFFAVIRRERVRYVGIASTSGRDRIHLTGLVRDNCPQVQVYATSANDLVNGHPTYHHIMRGVVIASTYPQYPANQGWTNAGPDNRRVPFASPGVQGIYNAGLALLGQPEKMIEYRPPFAADSGPSRPPVWITTTGENGRVVPLRYVTDYDDRGTVFDAANPEPFAARTPDEAAVIGGLFVASGFPDATFPPPLLSLYRGLSLGVILVVGWVLWRMLTRRSPWVLWSVEPAPGPAPPPAGWWSRPMTLDDLRASVFQHIALMAVMVLTAVLLFAGPYRLRDHQWVCLGVIAGLLIVGFGTAAVLWARLLWRYARSGVVPPRPAGPGTVRSRADERALAGGAKNARGVSHLALVAAAVVFSGWTLARAADVAGWWPHAPAWLVPGTGGAWAGVPAWLTPTAATAPDWLVLERALGLGTGYSVLLPAVIMYGGFLVYAYFGLQRDFIADTFQVDAPYPEAAADPNLNTAFAKVREEADEIHDELTDPASVVPTEPGRAAGVAAVSVVVTVFAWSRASHTLEGRVWDVMFFVGFLALGGLVVLSLVRFLNAWKRLERMLGQIALVPMVRAFDRLPDKVSAVFGNYLFGGRPRRSHLAVAWHLLRQVQHEAYSDRKRAWEQARQPAAVGTAVGNGTPFELRSIQPPHESAVTELAEELSDPKVYAVPAGADDREFPGDEAQALSGHARTVVARLLPYWPRHPVPEAFGDKPPKDDKEDDKAVPAWVARAEQFVAVQVVVFLSQFFAQLHRLARVMVACALLLLLAATCYPFQPERHILYALIGLTAAVAGGILYVLVRMERNELVSRITRTTPGRFQFSSTFVWNNATLILPMLAIAAAQLSGRLRTVLEPVLTLVR